jgi:hypothetical protein
MQFMLQNVCLRLWLFHSAGKGLRRKLLLLLLLLLLHAEAAN